VSAAFSTAQISALLGAGVSQAMIDAATRTLQPIHRKIGPRATALIQHFEGCRLNAYQDSVGVWTIGWGNTFYEDGSRVQAGDSISQARADALFRLIVARFEAGVEKAAPVATAAQFGAMVSLAYNIGLLAFTGSTLLRMHNSGSYAGAAEQFPRWNKAGGRVLDGLTRRRKAERLLYLNDLPAFDKAIGYRL